jgi:hypothetical protein
MRNETFETCLYLKGTRLIVHHKLSVSDIVDFRRKIRLSLSIIVSRMLIFRPRVHAELSHNSSFYFIFLLLAATFSRSIMTESNQLGALQTKNPQLSNVFSTDSTFSFAGYFFVVVTS